ncbi:hypothetical protein M408DRAFT_331764 [Serendipita vermifera MAFF 305830]|uniref:Uncharacterized protein n=1 Tax=Serendipita vermifera MAFF 305830 TaxID=933852 RepID=A0A0C2X5F9_SERVB|nr:hypothetical protein M408DRAFT_332856 [Serendipita vermifera MAFF 305830]KIM24557.1 hypothetical protein M408DRAFT_331764 [Serendipita vermifera MAFF 305830]
MQDCNGARTPMDEKARLIVKQSASCSISQSQHDPTSRTLWASSVAIRLQPLPTKSS